MYIIAAGRAIATAAADVQQIIRRGGGKVQDFAERTAPSAQAASTAGRLAE